jgi:AcrR family transcriptional regulator
MKDDDDHPDDRTEDEQDPAEPIGCHGCCLVVRGADMSPKLGRAPVAGNRQVDAHRSVSNKTVRLVRKVRRTRQALVGGLVSLVLEKRYAAITVQDLLDRADVARSTFYAHYRGKDDLLLRSFEGLLEMLDREMDQGGSDGRLAPVRELFHHIGQSRQFHRALARAHLLDRVYQTGTSYLSRTIARRLTVISPGTDATALPALAQGLAGALFAMLRWWVDLEAPCSPERMDQLYHAIQIVHSP